MSWVDALKDFFSWLKDQGPAILLALFQYEEHKVEVAQTLQDQALERLQIEKNHEAVDALYSVRSPSDIILGEIANAGSVSPIPKK